MTTLMMRFVSFAPIAIRNEDILSFHPVRFVASNADHFVPNRIIVTRKGNHDDPRDDNHSDSPTAKRQRDGGANLP